MGFRLIFAGLVFFFNPCINIVDILPDFIGCILISAGLFRLVDVEDRFSYARRVINRLIPIYILKALLSVYLPVRWKSGLLPFTFVFAVGEIILMLAFCSALYGGIEYMANLHGGEKHLSGVSAVSKLTVFFMIVKNVLAFLPEALALEKEPDLDLSYNAKPVQMLSDAKPYIIAFFTVCVLALGIYWLRLNANFFGRLSKDTVFIGNLSGIYKEKITDNTELVTRRRFMRFFMLVILSCVFILDITVDAINFTPDILSYILLLAAAFALDKAIVRKLLPVFVPLAVVSVVSAYVRMVFDEGVNYRMDYESYLSSMNKLVDNGKAVFVGGALSLAEGALFAILLALLLNAASKKYKELTGHGLGTAPTVVCAAACSLVSVFVYVAPYIKAAIYNVYINDTLTKAHLEGVWENAELAQGFGNVALIIFTLLLIWTVVGMRKRADFELKKGENLPNEYE